MEDTQNDICALCARAQAYNDRGYPEEVFFHCYEENCACRCIERSTEAIKKASNWYQYKNLERYQSKTEEQNIDTQG